MFITILHSMRSAGEKLSLVQWRPFKNSRTWISMFLKTSLLVACMVGVNTFTVQLSSWALLFIISAERQIKIREALYIIVFIFESSNIFAYYEANNICGHFIFGF